MKNETLLKIPEAPVKEKLRTGELYLRMADEIMRKVNNCNREYYYKVRRSVPEPEALLPHTGEQGSGKRA